MPLILSANAPKQNTFAIDSSSGMMFIPSILASYAGPGYGRGSSLYCDKRGGATWGIGIGTGCTASPFVFAFYLVLRIPFLGRVVCPLAIAGLGFKCLVTSSSDRLGHTFKKPFRKAFKREDILGLHIAWCPNLTVLARVCTECVNMATAAFDVTVFGDCGVRAILGAARDRILVIIVSSIPWEVHSFI